MPAVDRLPGCRIVRGQHRQRRHEEERDRPATKRREQPAGDGRGQHQRIEQPVHGLRTQPLPGGKRAFRRNRMHQPPSEAHDNEDENDDSKRDMERHGRAGLHVAVNVRHEPADRILHQQQRHDEPVEHLGGGPVLQTIGHDWPYARTRAISGRGRVRFAARNPLMHRACRCLLQSTAAARSLRRANENADGKHDGAAEHDLEHGLQKRRVHVARANIGDRPELEEHHDAGDRGRDPEGIGP